MTPIHWRLHLSLCHRLFLISPPLVPLGRYGWLLCGKRLLQVPSHVPPSQHSQPPQPPPPRPRGAIFPVCCIEMQPKLVRINQLSPRSPVNPDRPRSCPVVTTTVQISLGKRLLGWQLLSNYLVIPVVTVFCSLILVTLLTFDTVTGKISESKWKVTSK